MSDGEDSVHSSDSETETQPKKAKILVHKRLTWRSQDVNTLFRKLDRRISKKRSKRGSSMVIHRREGPPSDRTAPPDAPAWAVVEGL